MLSNNAKSAAELGYLSTSEVCRRLGIHVQATWIVDVLRINPKMSLNGGSAIYWDQEQISKIAEALISHLIPFTNTPHVSQIDSNLKRIEDHEYSYLPEILMHLEGEIEGRNPAEEVAAYVLSAHLLVATALKIVQERHDQYMMDEDKQAGPGSAVTLASP